MQISARLLAVEANVWVRLIATLEWQEPSTRESRTVDALLTFVEMRKHHFVPNKNHLQREQRGTSSYSITRCYTKSKLQRPKVELPPIHVMNESRSGNY